MSSASDGRDGHYFEHEELRLWPQFSSILGAHGFHNPLSSLTGGDSGSTICSYKVDTNIGVQDFRSADNVCLP